jgi:hypothetical protein
MQIVCEHPDEMEQNVSNLVKNTGLLSAALDYKAQTSIIKTAVDKVIKGHSIIFCYLKSW